MVKVQNAEISIMGGGGGVEECEDSGNAAKVASESNPSDIVSGKPLPSIKGESRKRQNDREGQETRFSGYGFDVNSLHPLRFRWFVIFPYL